MSLTKYKTVLNEVFWATPVQGETILAPTTAPVHEHHVPSDCLGVAWVEPRWPRCRIQSGTREVPVV